MGGLREVAGLGRAARSGQEETFGAPPYIVNNPTGNTGRLNHQGNLSR